MKTHHTPLPPSPPQRFDRRDFRLNNLDLYASPMQPPSTDFHPAMRIFPTEEFPLLRDYRCNQMVEGFAIEHIKFMGGSVESSNVGLQGWAERVCRAAGLAGLQPPTTWPATSIFRFRVFLRLVRAVSSRNAQRDQP